MWKGHTVYESWEDVGAHKMCPWENGGLPPFTVTTLVSHGLENGFILLNRTTVFSTFLVLTVTFSSRFPLSPCSLLAFP